MKIPTTLSAVLVSSSLASAQVSFHTDEDDWVVALHCAFVDDFAFTPDNVALASEVALPPTSCAQQLGQSIQFLQAATGFAVSFQYRADFGTHKVCYVCDDSIGACGPAEHDARFELTEGWTCAGFAFRSQGSHAQYLVRVYDANDVELGSFQPTGDEPFIGAVSSVPIRTIRLDDNDVPGGLSISEILVAQLGGVPVPASESSRPGAPPNPDVLLPGQTEPPALGRTWDPVIDHATFLPDAVLDVLGLALLPANLPLPPLGTLLCDPTSLVTQFVAPAPGQSFHVPIPVDCVLVGLSLCTQGVSSNGLVTRLTNALDLTIGTV